MPTKGDSHWDTGLMMEFLVWRGHERKYGFPIEDAAKIEARSHREAAEIFALRMAVSGHNMHGEGVFVALTPEKRVEFHLDMSFKATPA